MAGSQAAHRTLRRVFAVSAVLWAVAIPVAALAAAPAVADAVQLGAALPYVIGSVICHQQPGRSFTLWSHHLPVCARCTGIYAGAAVLVLIASFRRADRLRHGYGSQDPLRHFGRFGMAQDVSRARTILIMAALPTAATLAYEWSTGTTPSNVVRAITGVVLGAAIAWVILAALDDQVN